MEAHRFVACLQPYTNNSKRFEKQKRGSTTLAPLQNKAKHLLFTLAPPHPTPKKMLVTVMVYTKKDPKVNHLQEK